MGAFLAIFKSKSSTIEILEKIDEDIRHLRDYENFNILRYKKYSAKLMMYALIMTFMGALILYFYTPLMFGQRILAIGGLLAIPLLIWLMINLLRLYYENQKSNYDIKIKELLNQKEDILNNIKSTETYKNALEILERFDSPYTRRSIPFDSRESPNLRQRIKTSSPLRSPTAAAAPDHVDAPSLPNTPSTSPPVSGAQPTTINNYLHLNKIQSPPPLSHAQSLIAQHNLKMGKGPPRTPRPILAQTSGYIDRVIEYFINDGPEYRYALICTACHSHNGMAMKEEFPYLAFKCAYCDHFNPSRMHRPPAPALQGVKNGNKSLVQFRQAPKITAKEILDKAKFMKALNSMQSPTTKGKPLCGTNSTNSL